MASEWTGTPAEQSEVAVGTGDEVYTLSTDGLAYTCQDCGASFPVDPADPFDAHGKYLDHLPLHDGDHELDEIDDDDPDEVVEDPTDRCSCTWVDDPQCEYHHGPEAGY